MKLYIVVGMFDGEAEWIASVAQPFMTLSKAEKIFYQYVLEAYEAEPNDERIGTIWYEEINQVDGYEIRLEKK